ncbi:MAG: hypothetical protein L6437_00395, partial [Kiritimatiellae bacterium]|nr:hypothetical protein [Kiritimatiellia bacterium]
MKTMKRLETVLILGVVFQGIAFGGESVTQTGDVMVLAGKQLVMDNSKLVQDAAGTGGEAVESGGKAWYVVHVATPKIPAGRYRVTARIEVLKREAACHVGRLIVNSDTGDKVDDVTLPFGTENFEKAAVYKDFSVELVRPPSDKGKLSLLVRILHETPAVPVRVASIEIKALAIPPVLVHRVWPQKLLARCNADQPITVSVCNLTDQPQEALKLKLDLIYGLNEVCTVGTKDLSLKPYETVEAIFPWKTGEREYGYEARATVVDSKGGAISQHSDYFAVSRSHFKLRILGSPRRRVYFPDKNASVQAAAYLRETYGNYLEVYGWAPSAFVELYPRHRFWTSGQVSVWWYDRDAMKAWIDEMHRLGMWVTAYDI